VAWAGEVIGKRKILGSAGGLRVVIVVRPGQLP
jgi:hypothetical protein